MLPPRDPDYHDGYRRGHADGYEARPRCWIFIGRPVPYVNGYMVGFDAGAATREYARTHVQNRGPVYELLVMEKTMDEPRLMATHADRTYLLELRDRLNERASRDVTWLVYNPGADHWEEWPL